MAYERPFKVFHRKLEYCIISGNGTNNNVSIDCPEVAYLESTPKNFEFSPVHLNGMSLTITIAR